MTEPEQGETPGRAGDLWDSSGLFGSVAGGGVADEDGTDGADSGMGPDAPPGYGLEGVGMRVNLESGSSKTLSAIGGGP